MGAVFRDDEGVLALEQSKKGLLYSLLPAAESGVWLVRNKFLEQMDKLNVEPIPMGALCEGAIDEDRRTARCR